MLHKLVVIGSGPAGLTAAIYAARANLSPLVLEGTEPGGPLVAVGDYKIENFPGFAKGVESADLMASMREQAERFGAKFEAAAAEDVDFSKRPFKIFSGDKIYESEAVIIATGTEPRKTGLESEKRFVGRGVSYCATCDGPLFKNKKVIVLGGGNSALREAMFLAEIASEVALVDVADFSFATDVVRQKAEKNSKIKWFAETEVLEFIGGKKLEKIKIRNNKMKEISELLADGVFVAIGRVPNTKIFEGKLKMEEGFIVTDGVKTGIDGVFAAGDAIDRIYRQAIVAASSGCMAAIEAERYLRR